MTKRTVQWRNLRRAVVTALTDEPALFSLVEDRVYGSRSPIRTDLKYPYIIVSVASDVSGQESNRYTSELVLNIRIKDESDTDEESEAIENIIRKVLENCSQIILSSGIVERIDHIDTSMPFDDGSKFWLTTMLYEVLVRENEEKAGVL